MLRDQEHPQLDLPNASIPERTELWESVLETLRNAIVTGELAPGTRLVEATLSDMLHVSRWPVRQAITRLQQENLVVRYPNRGAYVVEFTVADVAEIYALRRLLEGYACRLACKRADCAAEQTLGGLVAQMSAALDRKDLAGSVSPDIAFHRTIVELSASPRLLEMWQIMIAPVHALLLLRNTRRGLKALLVQPGAHQHILDMLLTGVPDRAEAAIVDHLTVAEESLYPFVGLPPAPAT